MKIQRAPMILITFEFLVFLGMVVLLPNQAGGANPACLTIGTGVLVLALLITVLLTVGQTLKQQEDTLISLGKALALAKTDNQNLRIQFEDTIEKRVFELQVVNGALNREIAERIQAEEEIRELQKQLRLILDSAGEGILGLDNHGRVTFMNQAASLMLGWEVEELIGHTHHQLIHHTHADGTPHSEENCPIYMAYRDGVVHYKTGDVFWCKNGTSFPVEYVSTPIRELGMLTGAVVVFRDMNTFC